jgi:predicted AlkP superfamily pyrophosphatase or phosphodiesterase
MLKKLVLLVIIPAALLLFAKFGAMSILMHSWNAVVDYTPPFTAPLPAGNDGQPMTEQVVIVVVDALRDDASRAPAMPVLNGLRAKGATLTMTGGQPSLSLPGWSVIGTGTWQEASGVTTNWFKGAVKTDSIFAQAQRKGLRTAVVGSKDWGQLFGGNLNVITSFPAPVDAFTNPAAVGKEDDEVLSAALGLLKGNQPPGLLLVHFAGPDDAGHGRGGASDVYKQVVQGIDDRLAKLAAEMDLTRATLIVTSDHGTSDTGGHGGWEDSVLKVPFVAVGKGVKRYCWARPSPPKARASLCLICWICRSACGPSGPLTTRGNWRASTPSTPGPSARRHLPKPA